MNTVKKFTIVAGMALAFGGSAAGVFAQDETPQPQPFDRGPAIALNQQARLDRAAEALGVTADELQTMLDDGLTFREIFAEAGVELPERPGKDQRLERAAEALGITVDELQTMLDDGLTVREIAEELGVELPERPRKGQRLERAAEALGITVDELQTMLDDGLTVREIAEELGIELPERGEGRPGRGGRGNGFAGSGI